MSSLFSKLLILLVPFANAARSKARFDKLLEPGRFTSPSILEIGFSVSVFIYAVTFFMSSIFEITFCTIQSGVDAPAEIPQSSFPSNHVASSSFSFSIR